jgi:hypothetical protein
MAWGFFATEKIEILIFSHVPDGTFSDIVSDRVAGAQRPESSWLAYLPRFEALRLLRGGVSEPETKLALGGASFLAAHRPRHALFQLPVGSILLS